MKKDKKTVIIIAISFLLCLGGIYLYKAGQPFHETSRTHPQENRGGFVEEKPTSGYWSFAQITDLHYTGKGGDYHAKNIRNAVHFINAHKDDYKISFVLLSGDLVDKGKRSWMRELKHKYLSKLEVPHFPVIGNHDGSLRSFRRVFGENKYYSFVRKGFKFIMMGQEKLDEEVSAKGEKFLRSELREGLPTILVTHEPLVSRTRPDHLLGNPDEIRRILENYPNFRMVVSGHAHTGQDDTTWADLGSFYQYVGEDVAKTGASRGAVTVFRVRPEDRMKIMPFYTSDNAHDYAASPSRWTIDSKGFITYSEKSEYRLRIGYYGDVHYPIVATSDYIKSVVRDLPEAEVNYMFFIGDAIEAPSLYENFARISIKNTEVPIFVGYGDHGNEWEVGTGRYRIGSVPETWFKGIFESGWVREIGMPRLGQALIVDNIQLILTTNYQTDDVVWSWVGKRLRNREESTFLFTTDGIPVPSRVGIWEIWENENLKNYLASFNVGHRWREPCLIGANHISYSHAPRGYRIKEAVKDRTYSILEIGKDGYKIYTRDADEDITTLAYKRTIETSFTPTPVQNISQLYLVRDGKTISVPYPRLENGKIRLWNVETNQLVKSSDADWETLKKSVKRDGRTEISYGDEKIVGTKFSISEAKENEPLFSLNLIENATPIELRNKYYPGYKSPRFSLWFGTGLVVKTKPRLDTMIKMKLINSRTGETLVSAEKRIPSSAFASLGYTMWSYEPNLFVHRLLNHAFEARTKSEAENLRNLPVTLRLEVGLAENFPNPVDMSIFLYEQNRPVFAPLPHEGAFESENIRLNFRRKSYKVPKINGTYHTLRVGELLADDLEVSCGGSRAVLVEISGKPRPQLLMGPNPRRTEWENGRLLFQNRLISESSAFRETIVYALKPTRVNGEVLQRGKSVTHNPREARLPPESPSFVTGSLEISKNAVKPGEPVSILAKVTNFGRKGGTYTAILRINGRKIGKEKLYLGAGVTKTASFVVSRDEAATYRVSIGDSTASFKVLGEPAPPSRTLLIIVIVGLGVVLPISILAYLLFERGGEVPRGGL